MVKIENNMGGCLVSGRKLKYGEDIEETRKENQEEKYNIR